MSASNSLTWQEITLQLHNPFRVSYGASQTRQAFWLRLHGDEGWGEGTIPPYYGLDQAEMERYWQAAAAVGSLTPVNCQGNLMIARPLTNEYITGCAAAGPVILNSRRCRRSQQAV